MSQTRKLAAISVAIVVGASRGCWRERSRDFGVFAVTPSLPESTAIEGAGVTPASRRRSLRADS
jgi:hypothetical protein